MYPGPQHPGLIQVANQAQQMARHTREERMALAFQTVAMVSMAIMGVTAAAHLVRDLMRDDRGKSRG